MSELPGMWEESDFTGGQTDYFQGRCLKEDGCRLDKNCPQYSTCLDYRSNTIVAVSFKKLVPEAHMPTYAHMSDAGMDLYASERTVVYAYHRRVIHTGIAMAIPEGYYGQVRPRSGLAVNHGITAISSGVIDAGYRGEIMVLLQNHGHMLFEVNVGDRIAQLLILPVLHAVLEETNELPPSPRGEKGHGSTGK